MFNHLSTEQGLSQSTVNAIVQDNLGFMWFATQDGLNKYDSHNFNAYKDQQINGLSQKHVLSSLLDHQGNLWLGTRNMGLNKLDRKAMAFSYFANTTESPNLLTANGITELFQDSRRAIWIGTFKGLNLYFPEIGIVRQYFSKPGDLALLSHAQITSITEDRKGAIWVGTTKGVYRLTIANESSLDIELYQHSSNENSIVGDRITSLLTGLNGLIYIGTTNGLSTFNPETKQFSQFQYGLDEAKKLTSRNVSALAMDKNGTIWIGTNDKGLNRFNPENGDISQFYSLSYHKHGLNDNKINTLFYSTRDDMLWIGTSTAGIYYVSNLNSPFVTYQHQPNNPQSLTNTSVYAIYQDKQNNLWVGTEDGVNRIDLQGNRDSPFDEYLTGEISFVKETVVAITQTTDGNFWFGTDNNGVYRFNPDTKEKIHFSEHSDNENTLNGKAIYSIVEDDDHDIWMASFGGGINRYLPAENRFKHYRYHEEIKNGLENDSVYTLFKDSAGTIWAGTYGGGLAYYSRESDRFNHYLPKSQLSSQFIMSISESPNGIFWLGTEDGLNRLDVNTGEVKIIKERDGLSNNVIYAALMDQFDYLWLSTNRGLNRLNPETMEIVTFLESDGIQANEFNFGAYFKSTTGTLMFGGINGLTRFFPQQNIIKSNNAPVVITGYSIANKAITEVTINKGKSIVNINYLPEIRFDYQKRLFSVEFASLNYLLADQIKYRYKLVGHNEHWVELSPQQRKITYDNLSPGQYTLVIGASNGYGQWQANTTDIPVLIIPPLWMTSWAYFLYTLFALFIVYLVYYSIKLKMLQQKNELERQKATSQQLERLVEERTKIIEQQKQQLEESNQKLKQQVSLDGLTQLYNVSHFKVLLKTEIARSRREGLPLSILMIDVDYFKLYNDFYGHIKGDECLKHVASTFTKASERETDIVARYGGEEFCLLLPYTAKSGAKNVADKIHAQLNTLKIPHQTAPLFPYVTVSIGLYSTVVTEEISVNALLKRADDALYEAKRQGRDRTVDYNEI